MKRVFIIFTLLLSIALKADSQIYTSKCVMDKFDDVLLAKELKTIITQTDSTFIIEEKGNTPTEYIILTSCVSFGSANNIVNLVDNIYGYDEGWIIALKKDITKKYIAVHRVVTTQYTHTYENELFWIEDSNGKRISYMR